MSCDCSQIPPRLKSSVIRQSIRKRGIVSFKEIRTQRLQLLQRFQIQLQLIQQRRLQESRLLDRLTVIKCLILIKTTEQQRQEPLQRQIQIFRHSRSLTRILTRRDQINQPQQQRATSARRSSWRLYGCTYRCWNKCTFTSRASCRNPIHSAATEQGGADRNP